MAATQYKVLCRFINEKTNKPVTNDLSVEYNETLEFYSDSSEMLSKGTKTPQWKDNKYKYVTNDTGNPGNVDTISGANIVYKGHKLYEGITQSEKDEASNEKEKILSHGNSADNEKGDMIFAYAGTKRYVRKIWVPDIEGFIVRKECYNQVPEDKITRNGDYTGDYVMVGDHLVAKYNPVESHYNDSSENNKLLSAQSYRIPTQNYDSTDPKSYITISKDAIILFKNKSQYIGGKSYFTLDEVIQKAKETVICEIKEDLSVMDFVAIRVQNIQTSSTKSENYLLNVNISLGAPGMDSMIQASGKLGPDANSKKMYYKYITEEAWYDKFTNVGCTAGTYVVLHSSMLDTMIIPGHYEYDSSESYPYIIKDYYERIKFSPWFVNSTCGSLESAIEKAKLLVDAVGIDNVKVIKNVPFDQFIKIV